MQIGLNNGASLPSLGKKIETGRDTGFTGPYRSDNGSDADFELNVWICFTYGVD